MTTDARRASHLCTENEIATEAYGYCKLLSDISHTLFNILLNIQVHKAKLTRLCAK